MIQEPYAEVDIIYHPINPTGLCRIIAPSKGARQRIKAILNRFQLQRSHIKVTKEGAFTKINFEASKTALEDFELDIEVAQILDAI